MKNSQDEDDRRRLAREAINLSADGYKEAWQAGYRLSEAWFLLAEPYAAEQFRNAGRNEARSLALEKLLKMNLIADIAAGAFICLAMPVPAPDDGTPVRVPETFFEDRDRISWEDDSLTVYGRTFHSLRIPVSDQPPASADNDRSGERRNGVGVVAENAPPKPHTVRRTGRPSVDADIDEAIGVLSKAGRLDGILKKEKITRVRTLVQKERADRYSGTRPSETKIKERLSLHGH